VLERTIPLFVLAEKARPSIRSKHTKYVSSIEEYDKFAETLDFVPCPHCHVTGCLNKHGKRKRYDERTGKDTVCAARVFCNGRGNMNGCGRTYPVVLIERMSQYIVACQTVWSFLLLLLAGRNIKDAWEETTSAFCLDTGYKLRTSFIRSQSHIRTLLSKLGPPEKLDGITDPILQTIQRLKNAFRSSSCPVSGFQLRFQQSFFR